MDIIDYFAAPIEGSSDIAIGVKSGADVLSGEVFATNNELPGVDARTFLFVQSGKVGRP